MNEVRAAISSVIKTQVHVQMHSVDAESAGMSGSECLELCTHLGFQVFETGPARQDASSSLGLQSSCNRTVERNFEPRFDPAEKEVPVEILIVRLPSLSARLAT